MDSNNSHDQPKEALSFDALNFSKSPSVEVFLKHLRAGDSEKALELVANNRIRLVDPAKIDEYQGQILRHSESVRKLEGELTRHTEALQQVKQERDTLLEGVFHIYKTFSFVFKSIEGVKEGEAASKQATFLSKMLKALGLKNISPPAISVIQSVINHLRKNMDGVTQNVEQLGERLNPSLDILIKYDIVKVPKKAIDSPEKEIPNG